MYGLLARCGVKMAGYLPSSFFACFMEQYLFLYVTKS